MTTSTRSLPIELTGGLGNQLFQWAAGEILSKEFGLRPVLETYVVDRPDTNGRGEQVSGLLGDVNLRSRPLTTRWWTLCGRAFGPKGVGLLKRLSEPLRSLPRSAGNYESARNELDAGNRIRLRGWFQDARELGDHRDFLTSKLQIGSADAGEPFAAIHVRRGDYVSNPRYAAAFGYCSDRYYIEAIRKLSSDIPLRFVSDDPAWCEDFIRRHDLRHAAVVSGDGRTHFDDLELLTKATELVISNSTFSWWGAFLSSARPVVCPTPWFNDVSRDQGLALSDWIRVPRD